MKTANTYGRIIFFFLAWSKSGLSARSVNRDSLMTLPFKHLAVFFYHSNQQNEVGPGYMPAAIQAKVYHYEAVSFPMRDGIPLAYRFPGLENGMTKGVFTGMMATLINTEAIIKFIFHQLKGMDLKIEGFNQHQS